LFRHVEFTTVNFIVLLMRQHGGTSSTSIRLPLLLDPLKRRETDPGRTSKLAWLQPRRARRAGISSKRIVDYIVGHKRATRILGISRNQRKSFPFSFERSSEIGFVS
jgi:hypothetical protein